jgi:two-component system chemotaxis response regulator CheB
MSSILLNDPSVTVTVAADPLIAMNRMAVSRPDVILLDIEMPRMDGLTFLRKIMAEDPIPVVICSAATGAGTATALRALEEGAVDVVAKPRVGVRDFLFESSVLLVDALKAAARARLNGRNGSRPAMSRLTGDVRTSATVIAIGASTGGTEALKSFLGVLPPETPPIVIVQHMPEHFTRAFANRLNETSRLTVREAATDVPLERGHAYIAPGNLHTIVRTSGSRLVLEVMDGPLVSRHRPSVDVLFRSVAQAVGGNAIGVIMTGMGDDGAAGMAEMKNAGAHTIAQDEATSVVFGMPKQAIDRGAVDVVLALDKIAPAVLERVKSA